MNVFEAVVDFLQFGVQSLDVLAHGGEIGLDLPQLVGVCAVIAGHALEVSAEDAFLPADSFESLGGVVLKSFKLYSGVG